MNTDFIGAALRVFFLYCIVLLCLFLTVITVPSTFAGDKHFYQPRDGFVPDETTAVRIAEAVLIPVYGEEKIKNERPFKAILRKDIWIVEDSLPEGWLGGVAIVEISKKDGRIYRMSHGK